MAKKVTASSAKATDEDVTEPAKTALEELEEDAEESLAFELQAALSEVGDGGQVSCQLIKISPKESAGACTTYASGEVNIDRIREEFGAGVYKIFFRSPQGRIITRKQLSIVAKVTPPATPANELARLLEQREGASNNAQNTFLMMMKMMELSSQQMIAAITRPVPAAPPTPPPFGPTEMVAMMTGLASIMKPSRESESPMDALLKGVKLANELRGNEGETDWLTLANKGLDVVGPLLSGGAPAAVSAQAPTPPTRVQVTQLPKPIETPVTPAAPMYQGETPQENDGYARLVWFRGQLMRLVDKARADKDPALYADLFLDELPSFVSVTDVEAALLDEQWMQRVTAINPACAEIEEWLREFRAVIAERLGEAKTEADAQPAEIVESTVAEKVPADTPIA